MIQLCVIRPGTEYRGNEIDTQYRVEDLGACLGWGAHADAIMNYVA